MSKEINRFRIKGTTIGWDVPIIIIMLIGLFSFNTIREHFSSIRSVNGGDYKIESPSPNNSTSTISEAKPKEQDMSTYLKEHTFSYDGNGSVRFTGSTMTVSGGRATLEGTYTVTSKTTATFAVQAVSGDFDASNNALCGGKIELNSDGTLTETISDGNTTKSYQLLPKK